MKKILLAIIFSLILMFSAACSRKDEPQFDIPFTKDAIEELLSSEELISKPAISDVEVTKYSAEDFLFKNKCCLFYSDRERNSALSCTIDDFIREYPPEIVRTIRADSGGKYLYIVYELDDATRVFVFFDNNPYNADCKPPVIMKKLLSMEDFDGLKIGDTMTDVAAIDPIAELYRKGYDQKNRDVPEDSGWPFGVMQSHEKGGTLPLGQIYTIHLLRDGVIKITYLPSEETGEYFVVTIDRSLDFTVYTEFSICSYKIYFDDYVK